MIQHVIDTDQGRWRQGHHFRSRISGHIKKGNVYHFHEPKFYGERKGLILGLLRETLFFLFFFPLDLSIPTTHEEILRGMSTLEINSMLMPCNYLWCIVSLSARPRFSCLVFLRTTPYILRT